MANPVRAHAVLTTRRDGYTVSVRSPQTAPHGAAELFQEEGVSARVLDINRTTLYKKMKKLGLEVAARR